MFLAGFRSGPWERPRRGCVPAPVNAVTLLTPVVVLENTPKINAKQRCFLLIWNLEEILHRRLNTILEYIQGWTLYVNSVFRGLVIFLSLTYLLFHPHTLRPFYVIGVVKLAWFVVEEDRNAKYADRTLKPPSQAVRAWVYLSGESLADKEESQLLLLLELILCSGFWDYYCSSVNNILVRCGHFFLTQINWLWTGRSRFEVSCSIPISPSMLTFGEAICMFT